MEPEIAELIEGLKSADAATRQSAAESLGDRKAGGSDVVAALLKALSDKKVEVRNAAIEALGALGTEAAVAVPQLLKALGDRNGDVRRSAAFSLKAVDPDGARSLPGLVDALRNGKPAMRAAAAYACNVYRDKSLPALEALSELIDGPDGVPALAKSAEDKTTRELEAPVTDAIQAIGYIGRRAVAAVPTLVRALRTGNRLIKAYATEGLCRIGRDAASAVRELTECLHDEWTLIRASAAKVLGAIGPEAASAGARLAELLRDEDSEVRIEAAAALAQTGVDVQTGVDSLIAIVDGSQPMVGKYKDATHHGPRVRAEAVRALGRVGPPAESAVDALIRLLNDPDKLVSQPVAAALAAIEPGSERVVDALLAHRSHDSHEMLKRFVDARARIVGILVARLNDPELRQSAMWLLEEFAPESRVILPELINAVRSRQSRILAVRALKRLGSEAKDAVTVLTEHVPLETDWLDKGEIIDALGAIGPAAASAVPVIREACKDPQRTVRQAAYAALRSIEGR